MKQSDKVVQLQTTYEGKLVVLTASGRIYASDRNPGVRAHEPMNWVAISPPAEDAEKP